MQNLKSDIYYSGMFIVSLWLFAFSCKPIDKGSETKNLDSLVGLSETPERCGAEGSGTTDWQIDVLGYDSSKNELIKSAQRILSSAPLAVQNIFKALQGRVVISASPGDFCPGFTAQESEFAKGSICWDYQPYSKSSSLGLKETRERTSKSAHPIVSVSGDETGRHLESGLLRALGFLFVTKMAEVEVSQRGVDFAPVANPGFHENLIKLSFSLLEDVQKLKVRTEDTLFSKIIPGDFLQLSKEEQQRRFRSEVDWSIYARHVFFAEAFDSFYCSNSSNSSMDKNFNGSFQAFAVFDREFKILSQYKIKPSATSASLTTNLSMFPSLLQFLQQSTMGNFNLNSMNPYGVGTTSPYGGMNFGNPYMSNPYMANPNMANPFMANPYLNTQNPYLMNGYQFQSNPSLNSPFMNSGLFGNNMLNNSLNSSNLNNGISNNLNNNNSPNNSLQNGLSNSQPQSPYSSNGSPGSNNETAEVIRLSNEFRQREGKSPLQEDPQLTAACREHSQWMQSTNSMTHYSERPDYPGPKNVGENIASGQPTPSAVVDAWIKSPGHRANLVNGSYTKIGAANTGKWWCQQFR